MATPVILLTGFEPFGGERTNPSWEVASWLDGKDQTLTLSYVTPTASARTHYLTVGKGTRLRLRFKAPIEAYEVGTGPAKLARHVLRTPASSISTANMSRNMWG